MAVGVPADRFGEDALRMIRAVRLAAQLEFTIAPGHAGRDHPPGRSWSGTCPASGSRASSRSSSAADRPSIGLRLLEATGLLRQVSVELADQRGLAQAKIAGEDLWDHTLRAVDAVPREPAGRSPGRPRP